MIRVRLSIIVIATDQRPRARVLASDNEGRMVSLIVCRKKPWNCDCCVVETFVRERWRHDRADTQFGSVVQVPRNIANGIAVNIRVIDFSVPISFICLRLEMLPPSGAGTKGGQGRYAQTMRHSYMGGIVSMLHNISTLLPG
jgi:hypothetical protein